MNERQELRAAAIERLESKRELMSHVVAYTSVNILLVVVWASTGAGYFWPIWSIVGWGIAVALHAWNYRQPSGLSEHDIEMGMQRLEGGTPHVS